MGKDIVIITGGASGLGKELVKQFIEKFKFFSCFIFNVSVENKIIPSNPLKHLSISSFSYFVGSLNEGSPALLISILISIENITNETNLTFADIIIERN